MSSRPGEGLDSQAEKLLNERYGGEFIIRRNKLDEEEFEEILKKGVLEISKETQGFPGEEKQQEVVDEISFSEGYQYEHPELEDFYIFTGEFEKEGFIGVSTELDHGETSDYYTRLYFSDSIPDGDIGYLLEEK